MISKNNPMKKISLILFCILVTKIQAQVNIGANTAPNANAMLEISGNTQGLLLPRVALASTTSFAPLLAHVTGMTVYNTATAGTAPNNVTPGYYYNDGTQWIKILSQVSGATEWYLSGTTTDAASDKTGAIYRTGSVGIGTSPASKLDIATGATTVNTIVNAVGSINDFLQYNVQNTSTGSKAQSGYAATADNGTATTGFVWMGINNSNFSFPTAYNIGTDNDVSFLGSGQDMYIANAHNSKSIIFSTGKNTTPFFNERMRITNAGNVGIGTNAPTNKLQIYETTGTVPTASNGSIFLEHGNSGGQSSIVFKSTANSGSDYGYIKYSDDGSGNGSTTENSLLEIGVQNDVPGSSFQDDMALMPSGNLGIGTTTPLARLHVATGATTVNTIVNATGSINDYLQVNVQNTSTGTQAQSGYAATADNGTATTGFVWMGINNSTFNFPTAYNVGGANDVSFLGSGQDMYIANANNSKSIIFSTGKVTSPYFDERMRITNTGLIGIGTNNPTYPLDVSLTVSTAISNYGYLNASGTTGNIPGSSGAVNFSARFAGRVISSEFNAQSDSRIKDIKGISNSEKDLTILNQIRITDYEMKDKIQWGNKKFKKVIAQEIEKIYPQAVSNSIGYIPNIYQTTKFIERTNGGYILTFEYPTNINKGAQKVKIITQDKSIDVKVLNIIDDKHFLIAVDSVNLKVNEKVFVYGEEINDFRVVDYEALSTLNISATQQIYKLLLDQQNQINNLIKDNNDLKNNVSSQIQSLKAEMGTFLSKK